MASYATVADVQARMSRQMSSSEQATCTTLLADAGTIIDAFNASAGADIKSLVSCRMVIRALGDGEESGGVPLGATQASMSALGYTQSWTLASGNGAGAGELYLAKLEKQLLKTGNRIGSYSPVQELVQEATL